MYCNQRVCLSVCLSAPGVSRKPGVRTLPHFCFVVCGRGLGLLRWRSNVVCFRFCEYVIFVRSGQEACISSVKKTTLQWMSPGAKSDVYSALLLAEIHDSRVTC